MAQVLTFECRFEIMEWDELTSSEQILLWEAINARIHARANVSGFTVGAALESEDGRVFIGCNIEDFTHSGCIHAEMSALAAMVVQSSKPGIMIRIIAIALDNASVEITIPPQRSALNIESLSEVTYTPCGHCRTVLSQHQPDGEPIRVLALQPNGQILITSMNDLYPLGFGFTPSK